MRKGQSKVDYRALSGEAYELAVKKLMEQIRNDKVSPGVLVDAIPVLANYSGRVSVDQETQRMVAFLAGITADTLSPEQRGVLIEQFAAKERGEPAPRRRIEPVMNSVPLEDDEEDDSE